MYDFFLKKNYFKLYLLKKINFNKIFKNNRNLL
jgi:hypothetical protein